MVGFSLWLVSQFRELSLFAVNFPPLSFCAKPKAKTQNPSSNKLPSPSKRVETVADVGWGLGKSTFSNSSSAQERTYPQEEVFFRLKKCGFCNSGQALRAEWHDCEVENGRTAQLIKRCIDILQDIWSQFLFYDPNFDWLVEPLKCCISETHLPAYQPIIMGQYLEDIFNKTFVYRNYEESAK